MTSPIKCPTCPICGSEPLFILPGILPWFCPQDACDVLAWDPYSTLEENLTDAQPVRHFINGIEQP